MAGPASGAERPLRRLGDRVLHTGCGREPSTAVAAEGGVTPSPCSGLAGLPGRQLPRGQTDISVGALGACEPHWKRPGDTKACGAGGFGLWFPSPQRFAWRDRRCQPRRLRAAAGPGGRRAGSHGAPMPLATPGTDRSIQLIPVGARVCETSPSRHRLSSWAQGPGNPSREVPFLTATPASPRPPPTPPLSSPLKNGGQPPVT